MKTHKLSKNAIIGYPAGIITGITYGLNPLFGMPLIQNGVSINSILFFRYIIAVAILGAFLLLCTKQSFKVSTKQLGILLVLGVLYASSSIFLFEAYNYIASGLATTLFFLYPVLVAIIMVFSQNRTIVASVAIHIFDFRRCNYYDTKQFRRSDKPHWCYVGVGVCIRLCLIYSYY